MGRWVVWWADGWSGGQMGDDSTMNCLTCMDGGETKKGHSSQSNGARAFANAHSHDVTSVKNVLLL